MGNKRRFEGQTIEDAVRTASQSLGIPVGDLDYVLLDEGRRGVLGMGARKCSIEVTVPPQLMRLGDDDDEEDEDREEPRQGKTAAEPRRRGRGRRGGRRDRSETTRREDREVGESGEEPAEEVSEELKATQRGVEETLGRMFELMDLDLEIRSSFSGGNLKVKLGGRDRQRLTQKEGQLISALQFLLNRMARRTWPDLGRLQLQCDGYRNRRDDEVVELVREVASQVKRTGQAKRLHPMNPYERRLAHLTVRDYSGLVSRSEGNGFMKKITISPGKGGRNRGRQRSGRNQRQPREHGHR